MSSEAYAYDQRGIVRFYDPAIRAADPQGRTLSTILAWSDTRLEHCHDYIQNLFPLPEPSPFNSAASLITRGVFTAFRTNPELRSRLKESFSRMLTFYGFRLHVDKGHEIVVKGENFSRASRNWVTPFNHNHLRITRILRCLRVLGLEQHAGAFFVALKKVCKENVGTMGRISERSLDFWTKAATRPLYMAPQDVDDNRAECCRGFLWEFEESRRPRGREQKEGHESGANLPEAVVMAADNDSHHALTNELEDSAEESDKNDGTGAVAEKVKIPTKNDSDASTFSTRSKKRSRTDADRSPRTIPRQEPANVRQSLPHHARHVFFAEPRRARPESTGREDWKSK